MSSFVMAFSWRNLLFTLILAAFAMFTQRASTTHAEIELIQMSCKLNSMEVVIKFNSSFSGIIYSKGYFNDSKCIFIDAIDRSYSIHKFEMSLGYCGTIAKIRPTNALYSEIGPSTISNIPNTYLENTIIIQYDPKVQLAKDSIRHLECLQSKRLVGLPPEDIMTVNRDGKNFRILKYPLRFWMEIRTATDPDSMDLTNSAEVGQILTIILSLKDEGYNFDMRVRECEAYSSPQFRVKFYSKFGCERRSDIISEFKKVRKNLPSISVISFANLQAFKFPDSMDVHIVCSAQVCESKCREETNCHSLTSNNIYGHNGPTIETNLKEIYSNDTLRHGITNIRVRKSIHVFAPHDLPLYPVTCCYSNSSTCKSSSGNESPTTNHSSLLDPSTWALIISIGSLFSMVIIWSKDRLVLMFSFFKSDETMQNMESKSCFQRMKSRLFGSRL